MHVIHVVVHYIHLEIAFLLLCLCCIFILYFTHNLMMLLQKRLCITLCTQYMNITYKAVTEVKN